MCTLSPVDFDIVSAMAFTNAAIVLEKGKEYLVEARLTPLAIKEGFSSLASFIAALRNDCLTGPLADKALDALTTNETYFFRDFHPFEALRQSILPELIVRNSASRKITIWCAACSTGQEPYSIAMLIREHFSQLLGWDVKIIASDVSTTVLKQAQLGRYNGIEVNRGLPASYLVKYFTQDGPNWIIKDEIRKMVEFRRVNLIRPWPSLDPCDLIFIRNVMIYFNVETKRMILGKLRSCLRPQGSLFLGASETTINLDPEWVPIQQTSTVVYRTTDDALKAAAVPEYHP